MELFSYFSSFLLLLEQPYLYYQVINSKGLQGKIKIQSGEEETQ